MSARKGWRGYISSREINGQIIPQRVQNLVIRNYATTREMVFLLSATEYSMDHCFMMLESILGELGGLNGMIFYSTHQLPQAPSHRRRLYDRLFKTGAALHFALEELTVATEADAREIEDLMMARSLSALSQDVCL